MDGGRPGPFSDLENGRLVQISLNGRYTRQQIAFICVPRPGGVGVGLGVNSHRGDAQLAAGSKNTPGNFAPVGD
jgi:hypothetical protein